MSPRAASPRTGKRAAALANHEAQALAAALAIAPGDPTGVHEARKNMRRLRSLLALARGALGKPAVDAIDQELRALAKGLSALRDGQVVQETARMLARETADAGEAASWQALLPLLARDQQHRLADALHDDPGFMQRQALAHRQAEQLRSLPWHRLRSDDLREALARSMQRQARAQAAALASGHVDDLHDWRRKSRRLRMQLNALGKLGVQPARGQRPALTPQQIAALVDQLGSLQDLALLQQALARLEQAQAARTRGARRRRPAAKPSPIRPLAES